MFPNFFIVGAAKAGTTSLYNYLNDHPQVYMSPVKEPHFFSRLQPSRDPRYMVPVVSSEADYLSLFEGVTSQHIIGEASTSYLWDKETVFRLVKKVPDARIIILLRDPVDRAYSHFLMDVREGRQNLPFFEALQEDMKKRDKGWGVSHLYVEIGLYYRQVERYLKTFRPHQVLILIFENFVKQTRDTLQQVAKFLNLDPALLILVDTSKIHNMFSVPRGSVERFLIASNRLRYISRKFLPHPLRFFIYNRLLLKKKEKPPIDQRAKRLLVDIYAPDLEKLEHLLSRDLSCLRSSWCKE